MLSDPKRLWTPGGHGYLVTWKHRLRTQSEPAAAAIVERLLDSPANIAALRAGMGRPEATKAFATSTPTCPFNPPNLDSLRPPD